MVGEEEAMLFQDFSRKTEELRHNCKKHGHIL